MSENRSSAFVILRQKQLQSRTGISRSTIYSKLSPLSPYYDPTFPKQIRLGSGSSSVGWLESEVNTWIELRAQARKAA